MKEIFADIYNKVIGFFHQAEQHDSTKDVARSRLKVVLMQDRTNINPALLERMRTDLVALLTKYLEMDKDALELNLEQDGDQMALMLSIPVIRAKDEDEIEEVEEVEEAEQPSSLEVEPEEVSGTADSDDIIGEREAAEIEDDETAAEPITEAPKNDGCLCSEVECVCASDETKTAIKEKTEKSNKSKTK
jgi:cell division topological specificity factor